MDVSRNDPPGDAAEVGPSPQEKAAARKAAEEAARVAARAQAAAEAADLSVAGEIAAGYAFDGAALELGTVVVGGQVDPAAAVRIPLRTHNRHGLVAGATGTGKTKTLQGIAEQLSRAGLDTERIPGRVRLARHRRHRYPDPRHGDRVRAGAAQ